jgi:hypothetical protein
MLTEAALRERKWGAFPALRQVLEKAPSSGRHYGLTSVSDNVFEQLQRLVGIANQAEEQKEALLKAVRETPELRTQMAEDLWRLHEHLDALRRAFDSEIVSVRALCEEVHRLQP